MGESLGIVLLDGQPLFLDALRVSLLERGHRVLATTTCAAQLLTEVARHRPELCLLDAQLPDADGIALIAPIRTGSPTTKVIVLTAETDASLPGRALAAGARGFAHKSRGLPAVLHLLHAVAAGQTGTLLAHPTVRGPAAGQHEQLRHLASYLTPRERQCLNLLATGLDTAQIAHRLGVSTATARSHIQAVLTKLGTRTRLAAVTLAIRHGLLTTQPTPHAAQRA